MSSIPTVSVDAATLADKVREIAAKHPETRYKSPPWAAACLYVHPHYQPEVEETLSSDGLIEPIDIEREQNTIPVSYSPGCIVGQALSALGFTDRELHKIGATSVLNLLGNSDEPAALWLSRVQTRQDNGMDWGSAVSEADEKDAGGPLVL